MSLDISGKDAGGQYLPGHDHAHYLPTAEGDDPRRITHLTVFAPGGLGDGETAALAALRQFHAGDLDLRTQLVGLGRPDDFRAPLLGGSAGAASSWVSATPCVGPGHVGRLGRDRYLRKAIRREARRLAETRPGAIEVLAVEPIDDTHPLWAGRPRPFAFRRGRSRPGDDGLRRPFGLFRVTFSAPLSGPVCLGYASHYGLGLFLPDPCQNSSPSAAPGFGD